MQNSLPKNAKRVFKGVIFEVWQWRQKMFDGSFEVFEKLKRADTANVIAVTGNKILVQKQRQPHHPKSFPSLPGGRVDEGESPLQTAKRELLEETGYVSRKWILWKKMNPYGKIVWTVYNFIARDCVRKQSSRPDAGERLKAKLASFDEFLKISENPDFYEGELKNALLRARFDKKFRKEFYKLLFE